MLLSAFPYASAENWKTLESPESPMQNGLPTLLRKTSFLNSRSFSLGEKTPQATFFAYGKTHCCLITRTHVMQDHRNGIPARWSPRLLAHVLSSIGCSLCYFDLPYIVISRRSKSYPNAQRDEPQWKNKRCRKESKPQRASVARGPSGERASKKRLICVEGCICTLSLF